MKCKLLAVALLSLSCNAFATKDLILNLPFAGPISVPSFWQLIGNQPANSQRGRTIDCTFQANTAIHIPYVYSITTGNIKTHTGDSAPGQFYLNSDEIIHFTKYDAVPMDFKQPSSIRFTNLTDVWPGTININCQYVNG